MKPEQARCAVVVAGAGVHLREHEQAFAHQPHRVLEHEAGDDVATDAVGRFEIAANQLQVREIDQELARRAVALEDRDRLAFVARGRVEVARRLAPARLSCATRARFCGRALVRVRLRARLRTVHARAPDRPA